MIIVGLSFLIFIWLYYSWDIAKSFYPKSANELCQVAKVRESVLGINYIFPINERTLKSTAFIERETKNIEAIKTEIDYADIEIVQKNQMNRFLGDVKALIGILSDERNLSATTQDEVQSIAKRIAALTREFQKPAYGQKTDPEELKKEIELLEKQASWGATGMEIPPLAETNKGRRFQSASDQMDLIVEDFFKIKK